MHVNQPECPVCSCAMFRSAAGEWMCCLCGYIQPFQPSVGEFEPLEHIKVLTDLFDETPVPKRVYLQSNTGRIDRLMRGSNTIEEVMVAEGILAIAPYAFRGFGKLKKVIFPQTLHTIGEGAFLECRNLREITLPDGIEKIDHYAFGKTALDPQDLYVPHGVCLGKDALPPPFHKGGIYQGGTAV